MNEYDSAKMLDVLSEACSIERTDDPEQADILLLNTCSIREKHRKKSSQSWGDGKNLKRPGPIESLVLQAALRARKVRRSSGVLPRLILFLVHRPCIGYRRC